ncbi:MAG: carboxypeptidase regulatory-like domain-containing protein [Acidobacteria bacterium]|nr:carboxypeptidase regulatory-like domain-containing protein [Acidobacteriota bacterium]
MKETRPSVQYIKINQAGAIALPPADISGRVVTPTGLGLRNAVVILTDANGNRCTATTSSFGVYTFTGVAPGSGYILSVSSKRYRFAPRNPEIVFSLTDVDFVGLE